MEISVPVNLPVFVGRGNLELLKVDFREGQADNELLAHVGILKELRRLDLSCADIDDEGLRQIVHLPLGELWLQETDITDASAATLSKIRLSVGRLVRVELPKTHAICRPVIGSPSAKPSSVIVVSVLGTMGFILTGWNAAHLPSRFVGYVNVLALFAMAPSVLITAPFGVRTANRLGRRNLERLFGLLLLAVALDVAWSVIFWHSK